MNFLLKLFQRRAKVKWVSEADLFVYLREIHKQALLSDPSRRRRNGQ